MSMHRIGKPNLVQPHVLDRYRQSHPPKQAEANETGAAASQAKIRPQQVSDKLEISENARKLEDLRRNVDAGREALQSVPDVRQERLDEVRQRLQRGYYDSEKVRRTIATRLADVIKRLDSL
jgi:hypothetical protein